MQNRTTTRKEALICFLFFALLYILTARTDVRISDEIAVFGAGISLVVDGDLAIDELMVVQEEVNIGWVGRGGKLYTKYSPGNILITATLYSLFGRATDQPYLWDYGLYERPLELAPSHFGARTAMLGNAVLGAVCMAVMLLLLRRYFALKTSIVTVLLIGLTTSWWYQSRGYLSELGAGTLMMISLYFAAEKKTYLSGLWLGLSMLFRPLNLLGFPIWIASFWSEEFSQYLQKLREKSWNEHIKTAAKTYLSGFIIVLAGLTFAFYNWWRYESVFDMGYGNVGFTNPLLQGLIGVLFSPITAIFLYSPVLILSLPGVRAFYNKNKAITLSAGLTAGLYIIAIAKWVSWEGGFAWGERLLTPIIPLLGIFVAPVIERAWKNKQDFILIGILILLGFSIQLSAIANDPFWVMVDALENGVLTWDEAFHSLDKSWIALQYRSLTGWQLCDIDAWLLRGLLGCRL
jgi:hypothetical protein